MNLGELIDDAAAVAGMETGAGTRHRTLLIRWANEGRDEILRRTRVRLTSTTLATTANVRDYDLPVEALSIQSVEAPSGSNPATSLERVSADQIKYWSGSGSPDPVRAFAVDGQMLLLYPIPTSVYNLTIHYVPRATLMSLDAHDPETVTYGGIPRELHYAIVEWMLYKANRRSNDQPSQNGRANLQDFEKALQEVKRYINKRGGPLSPARVGRRPRRVWRNDQA